MKINFLTVFLSATLAISGCTVIKNEAGYPGGNSGRVADRSFYVADSHEKRVDRFFIALALLAPLAEATSRNGTDAANTARTINGFYSNLLKLAELNKNDRCDFEARFSGLADAQDVNSKANCNFTKTTNTAFTFESVAFENQRALFRLGRQAADNLDIRVRASALSGLSPVQLLDKVWNARRVIPRVIQSDRLSPSCGLRWM